MRLERPWSRLPRETVDAPCLEMFKSGLDGAFLVGGVLACGRGVVTRWSVRSLQLQTILWFHELQPPSPVLHQLAAISYWSHWHIICYYYYYDLLIIITLLQLKNPQAMWACYPPSEVKEPSQGNRDLFSVGHGAGIEDLGGQAFFQRHSTITDLPGTATPPFSSLFMVQKASLRYLCTCKYIPKNYYLKF